jgi:hypothetical protein
MPRSRVAVTLSPGLVLNGETFTGDAALSTLIAYRAAGFDRQPP